MLQVIDQSMHLDDVIIWNVIMLLLEMLIPSLIILRCTKLKMWRCWKVTSQVLFELRPIATRATSKAIKKTISHVNAERPHVVVKVLVRLLT